MRTLLRYLLFSGIAVGLAYTLFVVRVGDRSVFGHLRTAGGDEVGHVLARIKANLEERLAELRDANAPRGKQPVPPKKAKPAPKKERTPKLTVAEQRANEQRVNEQRANERQVQKLREAQKLLVSSRASPAKREPPKRTVIDERIADREKKAMTRLLR
ncbi:MAG: hypothetical protein IT384_27980 [Deltaproteobacteria bacterium]|nr:hypothetical protein [Deltaproteobacteria bacterium]